MRAAMQIPTPSTTTPSNGARLVATDGRSLPLRGVSLRAEAAGGIARVTLEQRFENPYDEPLRLRYLVPLPDDAAVCAYRFQIGERTIVGQVESRKQARERFERAVVEGRTAALLDEERGSLFSQELGNVPPRAQIVCTLGLDQPLTWLDEGAWEWRFPTVVAPRFLGEPGRTPDGAHVVVDVADGPIAAKAMLDLAVRDALSGAVTSPSHRVSTVQDGRGRSIRFAEDRGAALDRDIVVRWPVARPRVGVSIAQGRPAAGVGEEGRAYGLVTIVPPSPEHPQPAIGRDLCILLDTSGSMDGAPLDQARKVALALVDSLGDEDQLELIEFGDDARRWKQTSVAASSIHRADAKKWLAGLRASGGTDMTAGILEALATLREDAQRQVVLITDGQIGFEEEVLRQIRARLPHQSRLHTIGVGSAVNRSLTRPAARAGGGLEVVIGIDEDPERAASRIVRRTARPLVTELWLRGSALVEAAGSTAKDLFAGSPALVPVSLRPEGGTIIVTGRTAQGRYEEVLEIPAFTEELPFAASLFARERVADAELRIASGEDRAALEREVEHLGLRFQIATRFTSFVAVSDRVDVDATQPLRREDMPHLLPHGVSHQGIGLATMNAVVSPFGGAVRGVPAMSISEAAVFDDAVEAPDARVREEAESRAPARPRQVLPPPAPAPKPEPAKAKKEGASLGRRLRQLFQRTAKKLRARLIRLGADRAVIELALDAPLDWDRPTGITLRANDGTRREVAVDVGGSTAPGAYQTGQVLRLVVELEPSAEPVAAELTLPNGLELELELEEDGR